MASVKLNSNDANLDARLDFVKQTMKDVFHLKVRSATPVAYEEGYPFPYNNFVHLVYTDATAAREPSYAAKQPGTEPIPPGLDTFIFRQPNPLSGYNDQVRVENEIAATSLAREALRPDLEQLIPRVFGWESARSGHGWILQEYMPGISVMQDFEAMNVDFKASILGQMAGILDHFQRFRLPPSIDRYGGLTFGGDGSYISVPLSIYDARPFDDYSGLLRATIDTKINEADSSPQVNCWQSNKIRQRLDAFLRDGLSDLMKSIALPEKVLVHAYLSVDNILYDKETMKVTALFDFDFAYIGSVGDEFLQIKAMLNCFPHPLPANSENVDWIAAEIWDSALRKRDMKRPGNIPGMEALAEIFWLSSQILPFKLCNEVVVSNSSEEKLVQRKLEGEVRLSEFLSDYGF